MSTETRAILKRLQDVLGLRTQAQLAATLGIRPQSIVSAVARGQIPEAWLYRVAYQTGQTVEWLRTGRARAWRETIAEPDAPAYGAPGRVPDRLRTVPAAWKGLDLEAQEVLARCVEVLQWGDPDLRAHLIAQLELLDEAHSLRRQPGRQARARRHGRATPHRDASRRK